MNAPVVIPTNYTDAGKIFGFFELRNVIETIAIGVPLIISTLAFSPLGLRWTIILGAVIVVPACGFALIGVHDYSLVTFLRVYYTWRKGRRIISYKERGRVMWRKAKKKPSMI